MYKNNVQCTIKFITDTVTEIQPATNTTIKVSPSFSWLTLLPDSWAIMMAILKMKAKGARGCQLISCWIVDLTQPLVTFPLGQIGFLLRKLFTIVEREKK